MAERERIDGSAREPVPIEEHEREEEPKGKLSKKLLGIVVIVIALVMAVGMMLSNMKGGGGEPRPDPARQDPGVQRDSEAFLAELRRQEEEALRRRQEEEDLRRRPEDPPARDAGDRPVIRPPSAAGTPPVPSAEQDKAAILRERAAQSRIIAIQGDRAGPGQAAPVSVAQTQAFEDPRTRAGEIVRQNLHAAAQPGVNAAEVAALLGQLRGGGGPVQEASRRERNEEWIEAQRVRQQDPGHDIRIRERFYDRPVVHEGSIIPAILQTAVNSDLPGMVTAMVTQDVVDSIHGRTVVIPRGSRIVGEYNSDVMQGQRRLLFAFHRIVFPDGRDVVLGSMGGHDEQGRSGMRGRVNTHFFENLWRAGLLAAITIGAERQARPSSGNVVIVGGEQQYSTAASEILVDLSKQTLNQSRNRPPTITIKAGTPFTVMVNNDIVL